MEIHAIDVLVFFIGIFIIRKINPDPISWERDAAEIVYTVIYCTIFYFFDWVEILKWLANHVVL